MSTERDTASVAALYVEKGGVYFLGSSLGYLAIRGVVVLRHVTLAEARERYHDIRIERMPSLG